MIDGLHALRDQGVEPAAHVAVLLVHGALQERPQVLNLVVKLDHLSHGDVPLRLVRLERLELLLQVCAGEAALLELLGDQTLEMEQEVVDLVLRRILHEEHAFSQHAVQIAHPRVRVAEARVIVAVQRLLLGLEHRGRQPQDVACHHHAPADAPLREVVDGGVHGLPAHRQEHDLGHAHCGPSPRGAEPVDDLLAERLPTHSIQIQPVPALLRRHHHGSLDGPVQSIRGLAHVVHSVAPGEHLDVHTDGDRGNQVIGRVAEDFAPSNNVAVHGIRDDPSHIRADVLQDASEVVELLRAVELEDVKLAQPAAELPSGHHLAAPAHLPVRDVLRFDVLVQGVQVGVKLPLLQVHLVDDCHHAADDRRVGDGSDDQEEYEEGPHTAAHQRLVVSGTPAGGDPLNPPREGVQVVLQFRRALRLGHQVREEILDIRRGRVIPAYDRHETRDPVRGD